MRTVRVIVGVALWLGVLAGVWWWTFAPSVAVESDASGSRGERSEKIAEQLWRYASAERRGVELEMERPVVLAVGDPIFMFHEDGSARQVGEVTAVRNSEGEFDRRAAVAVAGEALIYPQSPPLAPGASLEYYTTPDSLEWVVETMLPPDKRRQIALELSSTFQEHQEEIIDALRPVVEDSLRDTLMVIEQDLPQVIERHRPELERLGERYRGEMIERRLKPLVQQEIWPIVRRRAEPLAEEIGQEIWDRASLWRFGWRYAYDVSPLPQKDLVEKEWTRFLKTEAAPILEAHTDEMIRVQQRILTDIARNERVRQAVRQSISDVIEDREVQRVAWSIFRETLLENQRLRDTLEERWRSEQARHAINLTAERMEPTVRRIGDMLFGTRETGITPEFARVLRAQILGKDRRWLVLRTPQFPNGEALGAHEGQAVLPVRVGRGELVNPFAAVK